MKYKIVRMQNRKKWYLATTDGQKVMTRFGGWASSFIPDTMLATFGSYQRAKAALKQAKAQMEKSLAASNGAKENE